MGVVYKVKQLVKSGHVTCALLSLYAAVPVYTVRKGHRIREMRPTTNNCDQIIRGVIMLPSFLFWSPTVHLPVCVGTPACFTLEEGHTM